MTGDKFTGNAYLLLPGYCEKPGALRSREPGADDLVKEGYAFIEALSERFEYELNPNVSRGIERHVLTRLLVVCSDDYEVGQAERNTRPAILLASLDPKTGLVVVMLFFPQFEGCVSQLMDRVSRDELAICEPDGSGERDALEHLRSEFGVEIVGTPRFCLSTCRRIDPALRPYLFANETFQSANMGASIIPERFSENSTRNIALYDLSSIYVGERTVLRELGSPGGDQAAPTAESDSKLLFVLELICYKEASVDRTNSRLQQRVGAEDGISLSAMDSISREFGKTMRFWDLSAFRYITAQMLADDISDKFGISKRFESYRANQDFLQHRLNIGYSIREHWQNELLFFIGVLVFLFEVTPAIHSGIEFVAESQDWALSPWYAASGSVSGTLLMILILFLRQRNRRFK